jgi:hypothetical protein
MRREALIAAWSKIWNLGDSRIEDESRSARGYMES